MDGRCPGHGQWTDRRSISSERPRPDQVDLRQGSQPPSSPCVADLSGHRMTGSEDDLVGSASAKTRSVLPVARLRRKRDGGWVLGAGCWSGAVPVKWQSWSGPSKHYAFLLGSRLQNSIITNIDMYHGRSRSRPQIWTRLSRRFVCLLSARNNVPSHRTGPLLNLLGSGPLVLLWMGTNAGRPLPGSCRCADCSSAYQPTRNHRALWG